MRSSFPLLSFSSLFFRCKGADGGGGGCEANDDYLRLESNDALFIVASPLLQFARSLFLSLSGSANIFRADFYYAIRHETHCMCINVYGNNEFRWKMELDFHSQIFHQMRTFSAIFRLDPRFPRDAPFDGPTRKVNRQSMALLSHANVERKTRK